MERGEKWKRWGQMMLDREERRRAEEPLSKPREGEIKESLVRREENKM